MTKKDNKKTQQSSQKLQDLEERLQQLDNQLKRAVADYQNLQKRHQNHKSQVVKYANQSLLDKLLPLLDRLKEAQTHIKDQGLDLIVEQLKQTLQSEGLSPIRAEDKKFDPETMDCAEIVPGPKDRVVNVITPGFTFHQKVLRPAKVEVGSGKEPSTQ